MCIEEELLREGTRKAYSTAAERPFDEHPFPVGERFAESLGYSRELLSSLPAASKEAFSGVSDVSIFAEIPEVGFREAKILRTMRNARTKNKWVLAAEVYASK